MGKPLESIKLYTSTLDELKKLKVKLNLKSVNETLQHLISYFRSNHTLQEIAVTKAVLHLQQQNVLKQCTAIQDMFSEFSERIAVLSANNAAIMSELLANSEAIPAATAAPLVVSIDKLTSAMQAASAATDTENMKS